MTDRSKLHHTKLNNFLEWVKTKGYVVLDTKGDYEVFRIQDSFGNKVIGHKRNKSDHITIHGNGIFLISEWLKER